MEQTFKELLDICKNTNLDEYNEIFNISIYFISGIYLSRTIWLQVLHNIIQDPTNIVSIVDLDALTKSEERLRYQGKMISSAVTIR